MYFSFKLKLINVFEYYLFYPTATILNSEYLSSEIFVNPFSVSAGFLPIPTSTIDSFTSLSTNNNITGIRRFSGNIFQQLPINVAVLLPTGSRDRYDLRLKLASNNMTIFGVDIFGNRLPGQPSIDWSVIATSTLYTSKTAFDAGCGAQQSCLKLPLCNNIPGCDGFSIPTRLLQNLLPANGYEFVMNYIIDLDTIPTSGAFAQELAVPQRTLLSNKRNLLQTSETTATSFDGLTSFIIRVTNSTNTTDVTIIAKTNQSTLTQTNLRHTFIIYVLPLYAAMICVYLLFSQVTKTN